MVGDLKVEGVDYFFNDWVTDEHSPHVRQVSQLWMDAEGFRVTAELASGKHSSFICDQSTGAITKEVPAQLGLHCDQASSLPNLISPIDCAFGRGGTIWYIDSPNGAGPREVRQLSPANELLRRLSYATADPQPELIEASPAEEKIFLVEKSDQLQRLRALSLVQTTTEGGEVVSDWKTHFEKKIIAHQNFSLANGKPVAAPGGPPAVPEKIMQKLRPNPLQHDEPGKIELARRV